MFGIFAAGYVLYIFFGCYANKLREYLGNVRDKSYFTTYMQQLKDERGHFWFKAECYHEEKTKI